MNLTVKLRLIITGVVAVLMVLLAGGAGLYGMHDEKTSLDDIGGNWLPSVEVVNQLDTATSDFRISEASHVMSTSNEDMAKAELDIKAALDNVMALRAKYEPLISSDEERGIFATFAEKWKAYQVEHNAMIELSRANRNEEAATLFKGKMRETYDSFSSDILKLSDLNNRGASNAYRQALSSYRVSSVMSVLSILVAMVLVAGFVWSIMHHIVKSLAELAECFTKLSNLDMRRLATTKTADEFGAILGQYNQTIAHLKVVVGATKESSDSVSAASSELSASMDTVAAATEEQSASLNEIATAVEETSASAISVMSRTNESVDMTQKVNSELQDAAVGLKALQEASEGIEDARNVIQAISEQINLLALNAAIEAARAGDAGRGFAVVADEVRKLASSTGVSIQQITERIAKLRDAVNSTTGGLQRSTTMMQTVKANADMMIGSVHEQTAAIEQISRAIHEFRAQMNDVTRSIHESKAASASLAETATELSSTAAQFAT